MDQEKEPQTSKSDDLASNLGIDDEPEKIIDKPVQILAEPDQKPKETKKYFCPICKDTKRGKGDQDTEVECICVIKESYINQVLSYVPEEYQAVQWDDFVAGLDPERVSVARRFFQEICKSKKDYKYSLRNLIRNNFCISIIGAPHSGVSTLGYLLLIESVWHKRHVFSVSWNTLVYEMNDICYHNGDRDSFIAKYTDPDVLFIDSIEESSLQREKYVLGKIIDDRHLKKNKLTIGGFNMVPNSKSFGNEFYNRFAHGARCLRVFLSPYDILSRSGCNPDIDQIGINGRQEKIDVELENIIKISSEKWK